MKHPNDIDDLYHRDLPADFPEWIAMWIMDRYALITTLALLQREKADYNSESLHTELMILTYLLERQRKSMCLVSPMQQHRKCVLQSVTSMVVTMASEHSHGWKTHSVLGISGVIPHFL